MVIHVALLLASLTPQSTPDPTPTAAQATAPIQVAAPIVGAELLPQGTLFALSVRADETELAELRRTPLVQLIEQLLARPDAGAALREVSRQIFTATGLESDELNGLLRGGATLAVTRLAATGPMGCLFVKLPLNTAPHVAALQQACERLGSNARVHTHGTAVAWVLTRRGATQPTLCIHEGWFLAATSPAVLGELIDRIDRKRVDSLVDAPRYQELVAQTTTEGAPIACAYVALARTFEELLPLLPGADPETAHKTFETLQLRKLDSLTWSARAAGGIIVDHLRIGAPEPSDGLLGALLGGGKTLAADTSRLVPPGVTSFGAGSFSIQRVWERVFAVLDKTDPEAFGKLQETLRMIASRTGVDIEQDCVRSLGERIVSMQWVKKGKANSAALLIETKDAWRLENALSRLVAAVGLRPKTRTSHGKKVYRFDMPSGGAGLDSMSPCYAFAKGWWVVASTEDAAHRALGQLDSPTDNATARTFLANLPPDTTAATWTDLAGSAQSLADMLETLRRPQLGELDDVFTALGTLRGAMEGWAQIDTNGVSFRTRSPVGNIYMGMGAAVVASIAIPSLLAARQATTVETPATDPHSSVTQVLQLVTEAQSKLRSSGPDVPYALLDDLVRTGHLSLDDLGVPLGNGVFQNGAYLITVLLPPTQSEQRHQFAALAWPADQRPGRVFAATSRTALLVNDVIAASAGIRIIDPADLFASGRFGTELVTGWRPLATVKGVAGTGSREQQLMAAILAAEGKPSQASTAILLEGLESPNPTVAARAAFGLGATQAVDSVPRLCEVVDSYPDLEVRRQAMAALIKLNDSRAASTAMNLLVSDDAMLRKLAATCLGGLRAKEAKSALLNVAGTNAGDRSDAVAALLALTAIGDTDVLMPAAANITTEHPKVGEALAYLFQSLSVKLPAEEEANALIGAITHPCSQLRSYCAQRLGQLGEPSAATALTAQLKQEQNAAVRADLDSALRTVGGLPALGDDAGPLAVLQARWQRLSAEQHYALLGIGLLAILTLGFSIGRGRRRRTADQQMILPVRNVPAGYEDAETAQRDSHLAAMPTPVPVIGSPQKRGVQSVEVATDDDPFVTAGADSQDARER